MSDAPSVSFAAQIAPLFRPKDAACMGGFGVRLADYGYMAASAGDDVHADHANARHVLARLEGSATPRMPPDGPWPAEKLDLYRQWIADGFKP